MEVEHPTFLMVDKLAIESDEPSVSIFSVAVSGFQAFTAFAKLVNCLATIDESEEWVCFNVVHVLQYGYFDAIVNTFWKFFSNKICSLPP